MHTHQQLAVRNREYCEHRQERAESVPWREPLEWHQTLVAPRNQALDPRIHDRVGAVHESSSKFNRKVDRCEARKFQKSCGQIERLSGIRDGSIIGRHFG